MRLYLLAILLGMLCLSCSKNRYIIPEYRNDPLAPVYPSQILCSVNKTCYSIYQNVSYDTLQGCISIQGTDGEGGNFWLGVPYDSVSDTIKTNYGSLLYYNTLVFNSFIYENDNYMQVSLTFAHDTISGSFDGEVTVNQTYNYQQIKGNFSNVVLLH
jgi:hypothetical protein